MGKLDTRRVLDPEQAHLGALRRLADFRGRDVVELGCGDGRLSVAIAGDGARMLAFDPDAEAVSRARRAVPPQLAHRIDYRIASGHEVDVVPTSFDITVFSWSL